MLYSHRSLNVRDYRTSSFLYGLDTLHGVSFVMNSASASPVGGVQASKRSRIHSPRSSFHRSLCMARTADATLNHRGGVTLIQDLPGHFAGTDAKVTLLHSRAFKRFRSQKRFHSELSILQVLHPSPPTILRLLEVDSEIRTLVFSSQRRDLLQTLICNSAIDLAACCAGTRPCTR